MQIDYIAFLYKGETAWTGNISIEISNVFVYRHHIWSTAALSLPTQKAYTYSGTSSMQIILLLANALSA